MVTVTYRESKACWVGEQRGLRDVLVTAVGKKIPDLNSRHDKGMTNLRILTRKTAKMKQNKSSSNI